MLTKKDITVGILAGGKATRMNNKDKGLVIVNGLPLVENLINKISSHTKKIIINANRNINDYEKYGFPVIKDNLENFQGPLSGIFSMLEKIDTNYLFTIPCDCPNFSWNVTQKIIDEYDDTKEIYIAHNSIRSQPVFMLISKNKLETLKKFLSSGDRKIDIFYQQNNYKYVYFDKDSIYFDNINTIEQLNEFNSK